MFGSGVEHRVVIQCHCTLVSTEDDRSGIGMLSFRKRDWTNFRSCKCRDSIFCFCTWLAAKVCFLDHQEMRWATLVAGCNDRPKSIVPLRHLKNVLHVPTLNKNIISVSKFVLENNAYIQFHPFHYIVKSQGNDQVLLQGRLGASDGTIDWVILV